jgi:hypothetical protein
LSPFRTAEFEVERLVARSALGQFGQFTPSRLSDRNGFVEETRASTGVTDGNAPKAEIRQAVGSDY